MMSTHLHVLLRVSRELVNNLTPEEVAIRWLTLLNYHEIHSKYNKKIFITFPDVTTALGNFLQYFFAHKR